MPATAANYDTLADVLHALGDIPPDRILWNPFPGTATEADQIRICESQTLVELLDGILVEKAMGYRESLMAATLIMILGAYVRPRRLGVIGGADAIMRMRDGRNRLPDVSFTAWQNVPTDEAHLQSVADFAPDLAIEVLSDGNTKAEIARKREDYFAAGTQLVWIVEPDDRTVAVYTDPDTFTLLHVSDTLTGGDVLPGFELSLAEFFNDPQFQPKA